MESNPIYRLELRQARRCGFLYALLVGGLVVSGFILHIASLRGAYSPGSPIDVMPFWLFFLGTCVITFYSGIRFVIQLLNEDPVLQTPLSAARILRGKFRIVPILALCYYGPSLPGVILLARQGSHDPVFLWTINFIVTILLGMVVPGFLAGTRTIPKTLGLVFLLGIFLFGAAGVYFIIFLPFLIAADMSRFTSGGDAWWILVAAPCFIIVAVQACFLASRLGIALLKRDRDAFALNGFCFLMILLLNLFWVPLSVGLLFPSTTFTTALLGLTVLFSGAFYLSPIFALKWASTDIAADARNDRKWHDADKWQWVPPQQEQ